MRTAQIRRPLAKSDVLVGLDFRNREKQQLEIGVIGVARFVPSISRPEVRPDFCRPVVLARCTAAANDVGEIAGADCLQLYGRAQQIGIIAAAVASRSASGSAAPAVAADRRSSSAANVSDSVVSGSQPPVSGSDPRTTGPEFTSVGREGTGSSASVCSACALSAFSYLDRGSATRGTSANLAGAAVALRLIAASNTESELRPSDSRHAAQRGNGGAGRYSAISTS